MSQLTRLRRETTSKMKSATESHNCIHFTFSSSHAKTFNNLPF